VLTDFALPDEALSPNSPITHELQLADMTALLSMYEELLGPELFPWEQGWKQDGHIPQACRALLETRFTSAAELGDAFEDTYQTLANRGTVDLAAHFTETSNDLDPPVPLPNVGDTLGKCVLTAKIGEGSTGVVYKAQHQTLGIEVAVKVLSTVSHSQQELVGQFQAEARTLARLNHPNIVRIWDFENQVGHLPYLILEYIDGQNLAELLKMRRSLTPAEALPLFTQVVAGLKAAHQQAGLIHRDIKPANVLLSRDGIVKVADLGLASILDNEKELAAKIAGTPAYMPPEQADGIQWTDLRSDIYSLGVTMYETVTGRVPFVGKSRTELLYRHAFEKPIPPAQLVTAVPQAFSAVIMKMLEKKPDDRFRSYDELLAAMTGHHSLNSLPQTKEPSKDSTPSRLASIKRLFTRPKTTR
jgi:serine/threonine protein kinase